jgi:4a-hydroxytetrahydrobiopterin dehydratase
MGGSAPVARAQKLDPGELEAALRTLEGWAVAGGKLHREFRFADFGAAFAFMTRVALEAEKRDHHPDWSNVWNRVVVDLVTHDAGGITEKDVALAQRIAELAK